MIRLSRLADYAVVIMCQMALNKGEITSSRAISDRTKISEFTTIKILKTLTKNNLITSSRGANGGYRLIKEPKEISILEIVKAIEAPVSLTICSKPSVLDCKYNTNCIAKNGWQKINYELKKFLNNFTLTDFIKSY